MWTDIGGVPPNFTAISTIFQLTGLCGDQDCSLGDQTDANSTPAALPGRPNVTIAYSGLAGVNRAHNPDPSRMSVASDIDFWMRPGLRFSTDTTPRQSRWDPNRQMQSFPGMPA